MHGQKLLIANRGEIALRIARAADELGLPTVAVYSSDDATSPHRACAGSAVQLAGAGPAAYIDMDTLVRIALEQGCTLLHPGYGFLSESAEFAQRCAQAGLVFIGPRPQVLELFGDKSRARAFAQELGVPVAAGTSGSTSIDRMRQFMADLPQGASAIVKAVAGGGGRGMRQVQDAPQLAQAFARCSSEAQTAFGRPDLYIEQFIANARHIEVQVAADGSNASQVGDRDCSVQQRHQKLVEIAPAPGLDANIRAALHAAALKMARACEYRGLCTFEFLVAGMGAGLPQGFVFMEANPRLQVEHTVTEEVFGVDLVCAQIALALGDTLDAVGLGQAQLGAPRGFAVQFRVNLDAATPAGAAVTRLDPPTGPGIRIDTFVEPGFVPGGNFDPLLAKLVVRSHAPDFAAAAAKGARALAELRIGGVATNLPLLRAIAADAQFQRGAVQTSYLDTQLPRLLAAATVSDAGPPDDDAAADGDVRSPLRGTVLEATLQPGARVARGQALCVIEAMKMEHVVEAPCAGTLRAVRVREGELVAAGQSLFAVDADESQAQHAALPANDAVPSGPRRDLQEVLELRHRFSDAGRPEAVARRHAGGMRTARENLLDLCDAGSFLEYGAYATAARHSEMDLDALRAISPADGFLYGMATINAAEFGREDSRCMVASYDYSVYAGTQGYWGHKKHDRLFQLAEQSHCPVVIFTEGGGGRPTEPDNVGGANLATSTFFSFARLSGRVPLVGIVAGRCFAGNAALLGCCDVVIATRNASVGMGGPVMIEGAGLGVYPPEEVGPAPMHARQGVVDILVDDEAQAVAAAKRYLGYFQGRHAQWNVPDQERLRALIPDRRTRAYDIRAVIAQLADEDSVLELRAQFALGAVTALVRIEGRPIGLVANNPAHNAGAVGSDEADKFTRFLKLCDAHGLPIVSLCDTPGIMVGPEAEKTAIVRHSARMLVTAANIAVPLFTIVLRKAYGLGAIAMGGGSFHLGSFFTVAWPTAELGGMGLEGQVRLGYRKELAAIADAGERAAFFRSRVEKLYTHGKATNIAPFLTIDDVIDPAETRRWLVAGMESNRHRGGEAPTKRQPGIDTW